MVARSIADRGAIGRVVRFPADTATIFNSDPDALWLQMIRKTELRLAKTEPFDEISQPVELF